MTTQPHTTASDASDARPGGSLQKKAWLITAGGLLVLGGLLALGVDWVFRKDSAQLEAQWVRETVRRVEAAQEAEVDALARSARDYASWTDTYEFAADRAESYVENNLIASMFSNLQLDAVLLFDPAGRVFAGRAYVDGATTSEGLDELGALLASYAREAIGGGGRELKGALKTSAGVALFGIQPILRDDGSGPPRGALAHVRHLHGERVGRLRETLNVDVILHEPAGANEDRGLPPMGAIMPETRLITTKVDEDTLVTHVPLRDARGTLAAVWHLTLPREIHAQGVRARLVFYGVMAVVIATSAVLFGWLLRSLVIARLEAMHAAVRRVGDTSDLSVRLPTDGADELSGLSAGINRMLEALARGEAERAAAEQERERLRTQLQYAQKMEAIGTLAGGLAHDFNNLLTSIQGSATLIRLEGDPSPVNERHLRRIEQATSHAVGLVRQMMAFGRRSPTVLAHHRLGEIVRDALQLLRSSMPRSIEFEVSNEADNDLVRADPTQLEQVLVNLGTNANQAMAGGRGRFTVRIANARLPDPTRPETAHLAGEYLRLSVSDTGCGIEAENLSRIFEPFYTTKPVGSGTGLGLAVVHGIVAHHHGTIAAESEVGRGTTIIIHLPKAEASAAAEPTAVVEPPTPAKKTGRLLLVDDDEMVRDTLTAGIRRLGYEVVPATGGADALELIRMNNAAFDLVLTDQMMPGMTGTELGQKIATEHPGLPLILMTGYASALNEPKVKALGFSAMLMKPVTMEELDRAIRVIRRM